jgi:uncharacterized protein YoxC
MNELVLFIIFCGSSLIVAITLLYAIYLNTSMTKMNDNMSNLEDNTVILKKDVKDLKIKTDKLSTVIAKQDIVSDDVRKEMEK